MKSPIRPHLLLLGAALLLVGGLLTASNTLAQDPVYDLSWWTVDGGGATFGQSGPYGLSGTIGQPDASELLVSGDYGLMGGFWGDIGAEVMQRIYVPLLFKGN